MWSGVQAYSSNSNSISTRFLAAVIYLVRGMYYMREKTKEGTMQVICVCWTFARIGPSYRITTIKYLVRNKTAVTGPAAAPPIERITPTY